MRTHPRAAAEVWVQREEKPPQGSSKSWRRRASPTSQLHFLHTREEEAPRLCRAPAVGAVGAQIPFICPQLLWVLGNYPFILRLALGLLGATLWKCLGYSALLISDPLSISDGSYTVQKAAPLPQERNTLILLTLRSSLWNQAEVRLQLNSHFGSFLSLFSELNWKGSLSHLVSNPSQALLLENLRKTISCVYSQLLHCMALKNKQTNKNHGARRNGRERVVSGNNLIKAFLSSIPFFSMRRPLFKEKESLHGGRLWEGEHINRRLASSKNVGGPQSTLDAK